MNTNLISRIFPVSHVSSGREIVTRSRLWPARVVLVTSLCACMAVVGTLAVSVGAQESSSSEGGETSDDGGAAELAAGFQEAFSAGDADALIELYAEDAVEINPFGTFVGHDEMGPFLEGLFGDNPGLSVVFSEPQVVHHTAMHRMEFSSDPMREAGIDRIVVFHTLVAEGNQIVTFTALLDMTDEQTVQFAEMMAAQSEESQSS